MSVSCRFCVFQVEVSVRARRVVPHMVCLIVIVKPGQWRGPGPLGGYRDIKNTCNTVEYLF
jgi:hypothetical protein